jgi:hypothetical protein
VWTASIALSVALFACDGAPVSRSSSGPEPSKGSPALIASPTTNKLLATPVSYTQSGADWYGIYAPTGTNAVSTDSVSYQGGAVLANPNIELVFWGSAWQTVSPSPNDIVAAMGKIVASTYLDGLAQYGFQSAQIRGAFVDTNDPPSTFSISDVGNEVWNLIDTGSFPDTDDPGGGILYLVFMPPGADPADGFPGEHEDYASGDFGDNDRAWIAYSIFPAGGLEAITHTMTHELVESITDPNPLSGPRGWLMDRTFPGGNEIGDACAAIRDNLDGVTVSPYWSQAQQACVLPFPPPPTVTNVTPNAGSNAGGTVVVSGTNFDAIGGSTQFFFGTAPATQVSCSSANACSMSYPPGSGTVDVTAQVNHFPSATNAGDQFSYVPSILGVSPSAGNVGDTVTISGIGLLNNPTIAFGGAAATNVACNVTGDSCTATVPNGVGFVDVVATAYGQQTMKTPADVFHYRLPTITWVGNSNRGPVTGGTIVGIAGTGFAQCPQGQPDTSVQVFFGNVQATQVLCGQNAGQLVATAPPASAPGPVDVTLATNDVSTATSPADVFTYTQYDEISQFYNTWNGSSLSATIILDAPGATATTFTLTSTDPGSVQPPGQEVITAGSSSITFPLTVGTFNPNAPPTIMATYDGGLMYSMVITPPPPPPTCTLKYCPKGTSLDENLCRCIRCVGTTCM